MRCRKIEKGYGMVFFGVKGTKGTDKNGYPIPIYAVNSEKIRITDDDNQIVVDEDNIPVYTLSEPKRDDSYADGMNGVIQSLTQRLELIQGELHYFMNAGFPITDKNCNKAMLDSYIVNVVSNHPDIKGIKSLSSSVDNHKYSCKMNLETDYGDIEIKESQTI